MRYINHTYGRSGTLWEGRYKASLVDSEAYLLICMRYIELNPVRAAMVEHPGAYRWSSYGHNAYGRSDRLISAHPLYTALGVDAPRQQEAYRELFRQHIDATLTHEIQEAVSHELVLGRDRFKERIEQMTKRQTSPRKMGRPPTLGVAEPSADYYVM